jgi:hypothetical protein
MTLMKIGYKCKRGTMKGRESVGREGEKRGY